ncbi:NAD(P)/FAD-dependent oxidoreductase [Thermodesulfobacteriota bacterium]
MKKQKHLIIGCGSAAVNAAEKIKSFRPEDEIKLVSMEQCDPYSPMSLTYLMAGRITRPNICLRDEVFFNKIGAIFLRGKKAVKLDTHAKKVTFDDGDKESYDKLLIATGSDPVVPNLEGLEEVGFQGFHVLGDMETIQAKIKDKKNILIYGGGLVAMSLALALTEMGWEAKVVVRSRILRTYFDEDCGRLVRDIFQEKGCGIFEGSGGKVIHKRKEGVELELENGTIVKAAFPVMCVGVKARASFLEGSEVSVNNGVVVNHRMESNVEGVYAAGDVAESPDFYTGSNDLNPIMLSAVDQGKIAGANMAGEDQEYAGWIPMNTFNFFGNRAVSIGLFDAHGNDIDVLIEKDDTKKAYKKLVIQDGRLIGASFLNTPLASGIIQYLIRERIDISDVQNQFIEQPKEISGWLMLEAERRQAM